MVLKFPCTSHVKDAKQPACGGWPLSLGDGGVHFICVPGACILGDAWCLLDRQPARREETQLMTAGSQKEVCVLLS